MKQSDLIPPVVGGGACCTLIPYAGILVISGLYGWTLLVCLLGGAVVAFGFGVWALKKVYSVL